MSGASNVPATVLSSGRWLSILCPAWRDRNKCYEELHQLLDVILKNQLEQHYSFLTDAPKMQKCKSWAQLLRNLVTCSSAPWFFHISQDPRMIWEGRDCKAHPIPPCHGHQVVQDQISQRQMNKQKLPWTRKINFMPPDLWQTQHRLPHPL